MTVRKQPAVEMHLVEPTRHKVELTGEQLSALTSRISPGRVATRSQGGAQLSYVEAWDIKAALIRVFGFGGFSVQIVDSQIIQIREAQSFPQHVNAEGKAKTPVVLAKATAILTLFGIGPNGEDVQYQETAIGTNAGWDIGDVADNAIKSAASDALKRCATYLGTQFGLSLYNNGSQADVVRVLLNPEQRALLEAHRAKQAPEPQFDEKAMEDLARSLGAKAVEVTDDEVTA